MLEITDDETRVKVSIEDERKPLVGTRFQVATWFRVTVPSAVTKAPHDVSLGVKYVDWLEEWRVHQLLLEKVDRAPEISTETLREVPVTSVLNQGLLLAGSMLVVDDAGNSFFSVVVDEQSATKARRADGPTPENLDTVAAIYRCSRLIALSSTRTIMFAFDLKERTAGHWVKLARERGHIPEGIGA